MRARQLPFIVAAALALAAPARADDPVNPDRPGTSNGPLTVGDRHLQVEAGGNVLGGDGDDLYTLPVTLRYGVGPWAELRLESDTLTVQGADSGVGDLFVGGKATFHRANPSLGVMARLRLPSGSRAFRQDGVTPDFTLLGTVALSESVSVEANALLALPRDGVGDRFAQWTYAATTSFALNPKWTAFAELSSLGPGERGGPRQGQADGGVAYLVNNDLMLDVDLIVGLTQSSPDWGATMGFSKRF